MYIVGRGRKSIGDHIEGKKEREKDGRKKGGSLEGFLGLH